MTLLLTLIVILLALCTLLLFRISNYLDALGDMLGDFLKAIMDKMDGKQ